MAAVDLAFSAKDFLLSKRCLFLGAPFDVITQAAVLRLLEDSPPGRGFRYVVTPNVDYIVRMSGDPELRQYVAGAWLSLCDSRPVRALARSLFIRLPLVTGSDLTAEMFRSVIQEGDAVSLVAPSEDVVTLMRAAYPRVIFHAIVPPYGVRHKPQALEACVEFLVQAKSRFVFLAIGSPQSDVIAFRLARHPDACGVGLNIGASLEFLTGKKRRAPRWMQQAGLEWLHRLSSDPKRLWRRYAYSVVPLFKLFTHEITMRSFRHS